MSIHKVCDLTSSTKQYLRATSRFEFNRVSFEWRIENFSLCPAKNSEEIISPSFKFSSSDWRLKICPNGIRYETEGKVSIYLQKLLSKTKERVEYEIFLKDKNGDNKYARKGEHVFPPECNGVWFKCIIKTELLIEENILCDDVLTVCCKMAVKEANLVQGSIERVFEGVAKKRKNVFATSSVPNGTQTLVKDLEGLLRDRRNCDVTLQVGDEKFPAHKWLLGARSTVFAAMFANDMEENRSNVVNITDMETPVMRDLLLYIYSGNVGDISFENALGLYTAADKYALLELKSHCSDVLLGSLSVDNVCDLAVLANLHNDGTMLDSIKFLAQCNRHLLSTEKWKNFVEQNPRLAYEITFPLTFK